MRKMEEWKEYKLSELLEIPIRNGLTKPKAIRGQGVKMIGMKEIFAYDIIRNCDMELVPITDKELASSSIIEEDLLFARQSLTLEGAGKCSIVGSVNDDTVFESHLIRVRINKKLANPYFIYYYFNSRYGKEQIKGLVQQVAAAGIRGKELINLMIKCPSLPTQQKIANILSSLDDKIEVNRRINEQLEELAQALFKSWFVDFEPFKDGEFVESELGMIPKGWKVGNLLDVATLYDSMRKPLSGRERDAMEKIYPYYGATSIMDYVDKYIFDGIYLLMGEDGSVVDDKGFPFLQYVWGKFWPNNHAHVMQGKNGFTTEMLHSLLSITNVKSFVTGAVQAKISQMGMKKINIVIAPNELLEDFSMKIAPIYDKIRANSEEITHLTNLRDTLLPKLMSGEIEVEQLNVIE